MREYDSLQWLRGSDAANIALSAAKRQTTEALFLPTSFRPTPREAETSLGSMNSCELRNDR